LLLGILAFAGAVVSAGEPRRDGAGDPLPEGAIGRLGSTRLRHRGAVQSLAFVDSGKALVSVGDDGAIVRWDVATGKELARAIFPAGGVTTLTPDGRFALAASGRPVTVLDARTAAPIRVFQDLTGRAVLSPDGTRVAGLVGPEVRVLSVETGRAVASFAAGADAALAFSPDATRLAVTTPAGTSIVEVAAPALVPVAPGGSAVFFSSAGDAIGVVDRLRRSASILRTGGGPGADELATFDDMGEISRLAFSRDGETVAGVSSKGVRVLELPSGKELRSLELARGAEIALSPDGSVLAVGTVSGTISFFSVATGVEHPTRRHTADVTAVAYSPDGTKVLTGSLDGTARLWDLASGKSVSVLEGHTAAVFAVAFSPDGKTIATASADRTIRLHGEDGEDRGTIASHSGWVSGLGFLSDDVLVSGSLDRTIRLTRWRKKEEVAKLDAPDRVLRFALSPDGKAVAMTGDDGALRLLGTSGGLAPRAIDLGGHTAELVAFSRDGSRLAASVSDRTVVVLELAGEKRLAMQDFPELLTAIAFSPDGKTLAAATTDDDVAFLDLASGAVRKVEDLGTTVYALAFAGDGKTLAAGCSDGTVLLFPSR
jgi:WD40 repeat protein